MTSIVISKSCERKEIMLLKGLIRILCLSDNILGKFTCLLSRSTEILQIRKLVWLACGSEIRVVLAIQLVI